MPMRGRRVVRLSDGFAPAASREDVLINSWYLSRGGGEVFPRATGCVTKKCPELFRPAKSIFSTRSAEFRRSRSQRFSTDTKVVAHDSIGDNDRNPNWITPAHILSESFHFEFPSLDAGIPKNW